MASKDSQELFGQTLSVKILAYLKLLGGKAVPCSTIARNVDVDIYRVRKAIEKMERTGEVRGMFGNKNRDFYAPTEEQTEKLNAPLKVRPFNEYKPPQAMRDLAARLDRERRDTASFFGPAIPTTSKQ